MMYATGYTCRNLINIRDKFKSPVEKKICTPMPVECLFQLLIHCFMCDTFYTCWKNIWTFCTCWKYSTLFVPVESMNAFSTILCTCWKYSIIFVPVETNDDSDHNPLSRWYLLKTREQKLPIQSVFIPVEMFSSLTMSVDFS